MCILALYFQEVKDLPLILAGNRDEFFTRPSAAPQIFQDKPLVFGGKDLVSGGTWLGVNENGLVAGVLNRRSGAETEPETPRSRGLLCLDILKSRNPAAALSRLKEENGSSYQPFNLLFANAEKAFVAYNSRGKIEYTELKKGVHVLSNIGIFDPRSERIDHAHQLFFDLAKEVRQEQNHSLIGGFLRRRAWGEEAMAGEFKKILSNHALRRASKDPRDAICVHTGNYGTVSSSVVFYARSMKQFSYYHASGPPCRKDFERFLSVDVL